jgi:hypothetical protein
LAGDDSVDLGLVDFVFAAFEDFEAFEDFVIDEVLLVDVDVDDSNPGTDVCRDERVLLDWRVCRWGALTIEELVAGLASTKTTRHSTIVHIEAWNNIECEVMVVVMAMAMGVMLTIWS